MAPISYFVGLDLGQTSEYTALAILERTQPSNQTDSSEMFGIGRCSDPDSVPVYENTSNKEKFYAVRHLERFPLGTSYPTICDRVVDLFDEPPLSNGTLVVDQTGVGRPIVDIIRKSRPHPTIPPVPLPLSH